MALGKSRAAQPRLASQPVRSTLPTMAMPSRMHVSYLLMRLSTLADVVLDWEVKSVKIYQEN